MGSVEQNKDYYAQYDWRHGGAEWSIPWGSTQALWDYTLAHRIGAYLPAARIVEIGAGHGRIAQHLMRYSTEKLYLFDIMESCVDACERTFSNNPQVTCKHSDGVSLDGIEDNSIDFIISFYALVHADQATIAAYTKEFNRVLKQDGVVFLHHSNAAIYFDDQVVSTDQRMSLLSMYRDVTMSAARMQTIANTQGLVCIQQECINWDVDKALTDCFSTIARKGSRWDRDVATNIALNLGFRQEMKLAANTYRKAYRRARYC